MIGRQFTKLSGLSAALLAVACGYGHAPIKAGSPAEEMALAPTPSGEMPSKKAPSGEGYERIRDNEFVAVNQTPRSTFSIDVDTAAYSNVRRFLDSGELPPPDAVRIEELINYFSYDYPEPETSEPFSVTIEVGDSPWSSNQLVHIGIQGKRIRNAQLPPKNLVFLIDVSGSMADENKLPLLRRSLYALTERLDSRDRVALVAYAGASGLVLPSTPASDRETILEALDDLESGGSTNGGAGIELAYRVAQDSFIQGGINRVLLATDGDFNVGVSSHEDLRRLIEAKRATGVFLTVLGFGTGNYQDAMLDMLAREGNGNFAYIDGPEEAQKVLVDEMAATLVTIAKDVKIQVSFNPVLVDSYRLIGYENRLLSEEDFDNDAKDAGDIGAGHSVTALYEITPVADDTAPAEVNPIVTVDLRYKDPMADQSKLVSRSVESVSETPSDNFRFAAAVAAFGMLLRDSKHRGHASYGMVQKLAEQSSSYDPRHLRRNFRGLVAQASRLKPNAIAAAP